MVTQQLQCRSNPLRGAIRQDSWTAPPLQLGRHTNSSSNTIMQQQQRQRTVSCRVIQVEQEGTLRRARAAADPVRLSAREDPQLDAPGSTKQGYLALLGVAILWGSYTPAIRLLYEIPTPPDPPLLNALQATLSALFLVAANVTASLTSGGGSKTQSYSANPLMAEDMAIRQAIIRKDRASRRRQDEQQADAPPPSPSPPPSSSPSEWSSELPLGWQDGASRVRDGAGGVPSSSSSFSSASFSASAASSVPAGQQLGQQASAAPPLRPASNPVEHAVATALNWRTTDLTLAGAEVGLWMCLAFSLEVAGLQLASATKVAFLNQVSVLITPLLVHLSGERVRGMEWVACGLGLLGSILVALDSLLSGGAGGGHGGHGGAVDGSGNEVLGLVFVLISSMFFALSTVRLGRYSSMFDSLKLSTTSTSTLGLLSLVWVAASILGRENGGAYEMEVINHMVGSDQCLLTLVWVGLGPGALAAYLQATGQKSVPPAQAQVIYSTTPLWAAGFAMLALDASDEAMGSIAWAGAAVMLGSSLMTALLPAEDAPLAVTVGGAGPSPAQQQPQMPMSTFEESGCDSELDDARRDGGCGAEHGGETPRDRVLAASDMDEQVRARHQRQRDTTF